MDTITTMLTEQDVFIGLAVDAVAREGVECADGDALTYVMESGCCPTCLTDGGGALAGDDEADLAVCPMCGHASVEARLALEVEERVATLSGLVALDAAIAQLED